MNVKLTYLYRDAGNYKHWQEVVLTNGSGKSVEELTAEIRKYLHTGEFFDQALAPVPIEIDDEYDDELDHGWLEFSRLEENGEGVTENQDISDFIASLRGKIV